MKYIIGVDGGGTKTEAVAYDFEGRDIYNITTGYGNLVMNKEVAVNNVIEAIDTCVKELKNHELMGIYLGLAGVEAGENREIISGAVKNKFNTYIQVYNDAELALYALLKGEEGILTIAGTGSISLGISKQRKAVSGGWGHLLGDEGSGYYIAINACKRMIYEDEFGIEKSMLTNTLLKQLSLQKIEDIKGIVYNSTKNEIASITPLIVKLAEQGEENALEILREAGTRIAQMTENVYRKLEFNGKVKVGLKGSVITKIKFAREAFNFHLSDNIKNVEIIDEDVSSCKGAYYLAKKKWGV